MVPDRVDLFLMGCGLPDYGAVSCNFIWNLLSLLVLSLEMDVSLW